MYRRELGLVILVFFLSSKWAFAIESADVLPEGIRSLSIKMGTLSGLNQYYTETGQLKYLSDLNSVELDVSTLQNIDGSVQDLVNILNQFGPENLGDQLYMGQLKIDTNPEVNYMAPIFLFGKNKKLTLGVGIPVVQYTNKFTTQLSGSNLNELRSQFTGASEDLDAAIEQLNVDIVKAFQGELRSEGYKPIENKNETFIGDVQLIGAYLLPYRNNYKNALQLFVALPTGPKADADDLTDIENFGRWSIKPALITEKRIHPRSKMIGALSYQAILPSTEDRRVPKDEADKLPAANQKDSLKYDAGDTWSATAGVSWDLYDSFTTTLAYSYEQKSSDSYSSSSKGDVGLLEKNTDRAANLLKLEFYYSTVNDFMNKKALLPATVTYELSQIMSNQWMKSTNVENQTRHELWLSVYF